jgi:hypothetical protein
MIKLRMSFRVGPGIKKIGTLRRNLPEYAGALAKREAELVHAMWKADVRIAPVIYPNYGAYMRSIKIRGVNQYRYDVYSDVHYARFNEYGSRTISARPSARMAVILARRTIRQQAQELRGILGI